MSETTADTTDPHRAVIEAVDEKDGGDGADPEAVLGRAVGNTDAGHGQILDAIDDLKKRGEIYVTDDADRLKVTPSPSDSAHVDETPTPHVPKGTLQSVMNALRGHDTDDEGVPFERLSTVLPFEDDTLFAALERLEQDGEVVRRGSAEFTHHDDGDRYSVATSEVSQ